MGGFGSGGWNRTGKGTTAAGFRLDAKNLSKSEALSPGCRGTITWTRKGETIGGANVCPTDDGVTLIYRSRSGGGEWADHYEQVRISWEECRFGGRRPFIHCPSCNRRVLFLYGIGRFLCRSCHGLSYPSQRERESDRAQRKANRIRSRLGGELGWQRIPPRTKGMHWRTYDRLMRDIALADAITHDAIARTLARFE